MTRPGARSLVAAGLVLASLAIHLPLLPEAMALHNADWAVYDLAAMDMLDGELLAFPHGNDHGGFTLTLFKALWIAAGTSLVPGPAVPPDLMTLSLSFSYVLLPALFALLLYATALGYGLSGIPAAVVGLLAAVGLPVWVANYGIDPHISVVPFAAVFLLWAARVGDPFRQLGKGGLLLSGIVSGLALYTTRTALPLVIAFYVPAGWLRGELALIFAARPRWQLRGVYRLVCVCSW